MTLCFVAFLVYFSQAQQRETESACDSEVVDPLPLENMSISPMSTGLDDVHVLEGGALGEDNDDVLSSRAAESDEEEGVYGVRATVKEEDAESTMMNHENNM
jgi:hypothetical protein